MSSPKLSFWEYEELIGKPDLVIIGSGIVGMSIALHHRSIHPHAKIIIIEKATLLAGGSSRNAGFACFGSASEILDDLRTMSEKEVIELIAMRWKGLAKLRKLLGDKNIAYEACGNSEIFDDSGTESFEKCLSQLDYLNALMEKATQEKNVFQQNDALIEETGIKCKHLLFNQKEGLVNTGKMIANFRKLLLQKNIQILNGLELEQFTENGDHIELEFTNGWTFQTKKLAIATNGFAAQILEKLEVTPARNLILLTTPIPKLQLKGGFHCDEGYYYFRNIGNRILIGGGRKISLKSENTSQFGMNPVVKSALLRMLQTTVVPHHKVDIERWWSGILGVGSKKMPILKQLSDRVVIAVRLGGMGVAIGCEIGEQAAELLNS